MYKKWATIVDVFLKVLTTDFFFFFFQNVLGMPILKQASVSTSKFNF